VDLDVAELETCALVLGGDLNFRVESAFNSPEDKAQGGKDFCTVEAVAARGNATELKALFESHELLHGWLEGRGPTPCPLLLAGCVDAVGESVRSGAESLAAGHEDQQPALLRPTFTFGPGKPHPRSYKDKRTPSWPDRILARNLEVALVGVAGAPATLAECRSLPAVVCSDHEAVVARFLA
jgi:hypothetical protein